MESAAHEARAELEAGGLVGGRYLVRGLLGRGGMGAVYDVLDTVRGGRCALKRLGLNTRPERRAAALTLFEREFLTLSQLQHPNVVQVYDYGVHEGSPFYTMELVAGADMQARVPLPWPEACAVARDLCGVLALLHSRRLIYRDLNPRNVRSTEDGSTKLIDFGAMCAMGPSRQLIGTPAFCAPESVLFQPLDGRTDLYSLGVMLYLMLTARIPFYVKDFAQMRAQPQTRPPAPSSLVAGIPEKLERLVLELLRSDPLLRPANASEVIDRLTAIAGLPADEQLTIPQAYLSTPNLVGRIAPLQAVRETLGQALQRRGASIVFSGESGTGRSRLLAACELEAKLLGITVLRPDVAEIGTAPYAAARALVLQLLELAPDVVLPLLWPHAPVLVHVLPELRDRIDAIVPAALAPEQLDQRLQPALRQILVEFSQRQASVILLDDVDRVDGESAALLALLAQTLRANALVLIGSLDAGARMQPALQDSLDVLKRSSSVLTLDPLAPDATTMLLGSVFGEVPNLQLLAHRLHAITGGNPRDLMQLAQHLVDQGVLRYRGGSWSVPDDLDALGLPSGMAQALAARVQMLRAGSRMLAGALAQCPGQRFAFDDCVLLAGGKPREQVMQALDELLAANVLRLEGGLFALGQDGWIGTLAQALSPDETQACNAQLAALFAARRDDFRAAQCLLRAGRAHEGLDLLVQHAIASRARTDEDVEEFLSLLRLLPDDWLTGYEHALKLCAQLGRPYAEIHALRMRLCGLIGATSVNGLAHFEALITDLSRSCGLDLYAALDGALPAGERLQRAFAGAQQRYEQTPPADRIEAPAAAVGELARVLVQYSGIVALGLDHAAALRIPSLEPLAPLSPALRVIDQLVLGVAARISGRAEQALAIYGALLERVAQPDRGGLDPTHHLYTVLGVECGTGMLQAAMGLEACLSRAARIEPYPQHQVNAALMRMLNELWQGRQARARQLKWDAELVRIQNVQRRVFAGAHLLAELTGYALAGELTGLKQIEDAIARQAQAFPAWVPVLHYARAEYLRACGDAEAALHEIEAALQDIAPGEHQIWVWAASAHLRVLLDLGRTERARRLGNEYLAAAQARELGYSSCYVKMQLSLALAELGEHAAAAAHAQACVVELAALGATGLNAFVALETRAYVAIRAGDRVALDACLDMLATGRDAAGDSSLVTCHDRIVKEARKAGLLTAESLAPETEATADTDDAVVQSQLVRSTLETCDTVATMAKASLQLLVRSTDSPGGLFFSVSERGLTLQAEVGELAASTDIMRLANDCLATELRQEQSTMIEDEAEIAASLSSPPRAASGAALHPMVLSHEERGRYTVVAVVVLLRSSRSQVPGGLTRELSRVLCAAGLSGVSSALHGES